MKKKRFIDRIWRILKIHDTVDLAQKNKSRIAELEKETEDLKTKIENLEKHVKSLQNNRSSDGFKTVPQQIEPAAAEKVFERPRTDNDPEKNAVKETAPAGAFIIKERDIYALKQDCTEKDIEDFLAKVRDIEKVKNAFSAIDDPSAESCNKILDQFLKELNKKIKPSDIDDYDDSVSETVVNKVCEIMKHHIFDKIVCTLVKKSRANAGLYSSAVSETVKYLENIGFYSRNIDAGALRTDEDDYDMEPTPSLTSEKDLNHIIKSVELFPFYINYESYGKCERVVIPGKYTVYVYDDGGV